MARTSRTGRGIRAEYRDATCPISSRKAQGRGVVIFCPQPPNERCEPRSVSFLLCGPRSTTTLEITAYAIAGDTYPAEVAATVYAVMTRLSFSNPYRLCWQSQVGPSAWLGAQTSDTVQGYVKKGQTDLILIPIAFTSDHIETLYELDQEVIHEAGHPGVRRADSLNGSKVFIDALADIALQHLRSGENCSRQMVLQCQGCKSERCREQKKFFVGAGSALAA